MDTRTRCFKLAADVLELVCEGNCNPDHVADLLQGIKDNPNFYEALAKKFGGDAGKLMAGAKGEAQTYPLTIDYTRSLKKMILAGKYDYINPDITADHFPIQGSGTVEVVAELMHFNRVVNSDEAIAESKKSGFRSAKLEELLAFGEKYPEVQREFPVVALSSVWQRGRGDRSVPYLWHDDDGRNLNLYWDGRGWSARYRFLGVRESISP